MKNFIKNKTYDNEWGEDRGNCSGLIKACIKLKLYLSCKRPCIDIQDNLVKNKLHWKDLDDIQNEEA
jgi:hypothetical protein